MDFDYLISSGYKLNHDSVFHSYRHTYATFTDPWGEIIPMVAKNVLSCNIPPYGWKLQTIGYYNAQKLKARGKRNGNENHTRYQDIQ